MINIGAFIEFDKKINNKVLGYKKKVKNKFGNQIYLDHPVHSTLFTIKIKKISELKKIYKNDINIKKKSFKINLTSSKIFYHDPLTKGHTLYYKIKKTKILKNIQMQHLTKINRNINVLKKESFLFKKLILKQNYKKYGFPFSGPIWIPHTTVASIKGVDKNNVFIRRFLKSKINLKCDISFINFYKIMKNKHKFLFKVGIK